MKNKHMLLTICLAILVNGFSICFAYDDAGEARRIYMEAKKEGIKREFTNAIDLFEKLLTEYPESSYSDDARFWIGYYLEKIPDKQMAAFSAFSNLIESHPTSPWKDDAIVHQIGLAEQFIRKGLNQYNTFLYEMLESENSDIRNRAALSLGRLGNDKALPVLKQLRDDEDFGSIVAALIPKLEKGKTGAVVDTLGEDMRLAYETGREAADELSRKDGLLWFSSQRYDQYRSMLQKDESWTKQELYTFALWHIVDTDDFEAFQSLSNEYDKKEWLRKFWKKRDPTPTTDENELYQEFEKRIQFARAHFSDYWNFRHFNYLQDQYLKQGDYHAPWDARGELYIKYGEPDMRSVSGWQREEWVYYRYNVDFLVKQYMTNIYGNAIGAGELTFKKHENFNMPYKSGSQVSMLSDNDASVHIQNMINTFLQAQFIFKNEIRYEHDYQAEPIDDFELEVDRKLSMKEEKLVLRIRIPVNELELEKADGAYHLKFLVRYVVLDQDLRSVQESEKIIERDDITDDDQKLEEVIKINLPPGQYKVHLRIEDLKSNNLGIYSQEITIST
jgi:hypothetical protein